MEKSSSSSRTQPPTPRLAAHHWSLHHLPVEEAFRTAAALGYRGLDIAVGDTGHGERVSLARLAGDAGYRRDLRASADAAGVTITDFVGGVIQFPRAPAELRDEQRRNLMLFAEHAADLDLDGFTLLPGFFGETPYEEAFEDVAAELTTIVDGAARFGVRVSIEAHLESVTDTPARAARMLERVPGLTLTLDYSHFVYGGSTAEDIEPLHERTRHVHLRQAAPGALSTPVDAGTIDHRRLLASLHDTGYAGAFATEYVASPWYDQDKVDVPTENEAMRREAAALIGEIWP